MKNKNQPYDKKRNLNPTASEEPVDLICLGIDQHADSLVVVEQINACVPKAARKFTQSAKFFDWLESRRKNAARIVVCYEAGPCGYWLCRQLQALGVECIVVAPKKWAENGKTKTDARDARVLCERLFHWVQGKSNVFTLVRVPSEKQERRRALSRNRERMIKERKRLAQSGRGIGLQYQMRLRGQWWKGKKWTEVASSLEELLGVIREVLLTIEKQIGILTRQLESFAATKEKRPAGLGALTDAVIASEVGDYERFNNRRAPGAFFGVVPGENSSGGRRRQLPITKSGSGMVRRYLVEAVWRLIRFQPGWHSWKKWQQRYEEAPKWRRNQIVVAMARQLIIDLWRLRTERTTMEALGWTPATT
jgi:transposase